METQDTNETPWPKEIDGKVNLHGHFDARVWAKEFCKMYESALCQIPGQEGVTNGEDWEETMVAWFSNAIMTGHDHANWANGKLPNCSLPWPESD